MNEYTFEMYTDVTEQTTVKANSQEQAEAVILSGNCEWEEIKSQGGDFYLVNEEEIVESKVNPIPFVDRLKIAYDKSKDEEII